MVHRVITQARAVVLVLPLLALALLPRNMHTPAYAAAQLILLAPVAAAARGLMCRGLKALFSRNPGLDSLAAAAAGMAVVYSLHSVGRAMAGDNTPADFYFGAAGAVLALALTSGVRTTAALYTPAAFAVSALAGIAWMLAGRSTSFAFTAFMTTLVCAYLLPVINRLRTAAFAPADKTPMPAAMSSPDTDN